MAIINVLISTDDKITAIKLLKEISDKSSSELMQCLGQPTPIITWNTEDYPVECELVEHIESIRNQLSTLNELDTVLVDLTNAGATIVSEAKDSTWGRRAVIDDPEGHRVEILEAK